MAWLMRRFEPEPSHLTSVRDLGILIVVAGILVPGLTALPAGALAHYAAGVPIIHNMVGWFCAQGRSYLALFGLDYFKRVNDRFGHATGDDVLRAFAAILKASVRSAGTVARLGGEEFGVLFDGLSLAEAQEACERVRSQFAAASITAPDGSSVATTVSVGLAALREKQCLEDALQAADAALYESKGAGRNRLSIAA